MLKSKLIWLLVPIVFIVGLFLGYQSFLLKNDAKFQILTKVGDVFQHVTGNYYEEIDTTALIEGAINGMLDKLDPHTLYISPDEQMGISEQFQGNFAPR